MRAFSLYNNFITTLIFLIIRGVRTVHGAWQATCVVRPPYMNNALPFAPNSVAVPEWEVETGTPPAFNFFAAPRPDCTLVWPLEFSVWIDRSDHIVFVSPQWESFAASSFDTPITATQVLHRPVAEFLTDETTRECYRLLFERVRRDGRAARVALRCDLPEEPRAMRLTFTPLHEGALECSWAFLRPSVAVDIGQSPRRRFHDGELVRMCSWCRLVHTAWTWQPIELAGPSLGLFDHAHLPQISHGICPDCSMMLMAESSVGRDARHAV